MTGSDTNQFLVEFGKLLKKRRKEMSLSQVNASLQMKIDYRHYQNIEGGKINLRLETMVKLIQFYGLDHERGGLSLDTFVSLMESKTASRKGEWDILQDYFIRSGVGGFGVINREKRLEKINPWLARKMGSTPGELNGSTYLVISDDSRLDFESRMEALFQTGLCNPFIVKLRTTAGEKLPFLCIPRIQNLNSSASVEAFAIFLDEMTLNQEADRIYHLLHHFRSLLTNEPRLVKGSHQEWRMA